MSNDMIYKQVGEVSAQVAMQEKLVSEVRQRTIDIGTELAVFSSAVQEFQKVLRELLSKAEVMKDITVQNASELKLINKEIEDLDDALKKLETGTYEKIKEISGKISELDKKIWEKVTDIEKKILDHEYYINNKKDEDNKKKDTFHKVKTSVITWIIIGILAAAAAAFAAYYGITPSNPSK